MGVGVGLGDEVGCGEGGAGDGGAEDTGPPGVGSAVGLAGALVGLRCLPGFLVAVGVGTSAWTGWPTGCGAAGGAGRAVALPSGLPALGRVTTDFAFSAAAPLTVAGPGPESRIPTAATPPATTIAVRAAALRIRRVGGFRCRCGGRGGSGWRGGGTGRLPKPL